MTSRTFTNSALSTKNALMARGNKYKVLENMKYRLVTGSKIDQVSKVHQNKECQVKTKVFRNN